MMHKIILLLVFDDINIVNFNRLTSINLDFD